MIILIDNYPIHWSFVNDRSKSFIFKIDFYLEFFSSLEGSVKDKPFQYKPVSKTFYNVIVTKSAFPYVMRLFVICLIEICPVKFCKIQVGVVAIAY